ncbi:MAG: stage II sporulation protein P [Clostridiales bacterium]|nr:stage II sporulation protein P [Clostridiales bacterium]
MVTLGIFAILRPRFIKKNGGADTQAAAEGLEFERVRAEEVIGLSSGVWRPEGPGEAAQAAPSAGEPDLSRAGDLAYLREKFYTVDSRTGMDPALFNAAEFEKTPLRVERSLKTPKILIFHTHSQEMFADSRDKSEGVIAVGEALSRELSRNYGLPCVHNTDSFDIVDGESRILGAYERMEPVIRRVLKENPSIEMVIDLHRDGLPPNAPPQTAVVGGRTCAKVMFFNGLCALKENGELRPLADLPNPYLKENLALSFRAEIKAGEMYPGFAKKVYLNSYRYSLHMLPKSLFVEVGSQHNTKEQAVNSAKPLAAVIAAAVS